MLQGKMLLDASIWLGLLKTNDKHHAKCKTFFQELQKTSLSGNEVKILLPCHTLFEINTKLRKLKKDPRWTGHQPFKIEGVVEYYPLDDRLISKVQQG